MLRNILFFIILLSVITLSGCQQAQDQQDVMSAIGEPTVLFNITSDAFADPHSVTMAMQLAGHSLSAGRKVVLFFNVRSVNVPTNDFPDDVAFKDKPIKSLLAELIEKGAEVQVCPHCMMAMEVKEEDLITGAKVTTEEMLFSKLGANTVVFSY